MEDRHSLNKLNNIANRMQLLNRFLNRSSKIRDAKSCSNLFLILILKPCAILYRITCHQRTMKSFLLVSYQSSRMVRLEIPLTLEVSTNT